MVDCGAVRSLRNGSGDSMFDDNDNNYFRSDSEFSRRDSTERDTEFSEGMERDAGTLYSGVNTDRYISASRCIFFSILVLSALLCAVVSYALYEIEEKENFKRSFESQSEELALYTNHNIDNVFATFEGLSTATTSLVKEAWISSNLQTPAGFVDIPDIKYQLGQARETTNALAIVYAPKVMNDDYDAWVEYSESHKNWIPLNQPGGPVKITPEIPSFIWQWEDEPDFATSNSMDATNTSESDSASINSRSLRSNMDGLQRPHDCSGDYLHRRQLQEDAKATDDKMEQMDDHADASEIQVASPLNETYYTPVWQMVPVPVINETHRDVPIINYNLMDRRVFNKAANFLSFSKTPVFLDVCDQSAWFGIEEHKEIIQTVVTVPIFRDFQDDAPIAGFVAATIPWAEFFENNMNKDSDEIIVVMENTCDEIFSVSVSGPYIEMLGEEDLHDPNYDDMAIEVPFAQAYNRKVEREDYKGDICIYTMTMYPTASYEASFKSNRPWITSLLVVLVFVFTSLAFILFDCLVTRRQTKLLKTALRQSAIVNSLFPKMVQKKLMEQVDVKLEAKAEKKSIKRNLVTFLDDSRELSIREPLDTKPIADLFPNTTIMFADIAGFTAWSSTREPEAVFTLLETIYRAFDEIAKKRRVFKVEVVGDCYVAVCGLPDPRKDHFAVMCRFAQECLRAMQIYTKELEVKLGPDTGDLGLRIGLHSGPVVAGVLRGEKSRFQLFGDTMNTASRMESTGVSNRIQLSQATADFLIDAGKEHWITKRQDRVKVKGKGELTTYFLLSVRTKTSDGNSLARTPLSNEVVVSNHDNSNGSSCGGQRWQERNRVADWVVEMLGKLLREMAEKRRVANIKPENLSTITKLEKQKLGNHSRHLSNQTVIDEVVECLSIPDCVASKAMSTENPAPLDQKVIDELQDYVYSIASLYRKNAFHNFEHASHVSMSCIKLLNRIASCDDQLEGGKDNSYGICSDPFTSFAIVFSALIHDVDHTGAPNVQLVKEQAPVATIYKEKSVAEQNSIDVGWCLLMEPTYAHLRRHIYTTAAEFRFFRQMVVNCVMATDIVDKDLIKARNQRWDLAFNTEKTTEDDCNLRSTIVIEHLIQLSDIAHTMQHWQIYRRWNERLFEESYVAYAECRAEKNPSDYWYQGELGFYDFYIIPLANKIKQCQVFGVSSDEYLSYALQNRQEWEVRGKDVVQEMAKKYESIHHAAISRQLLELERKVEVSGNCQGLGSA